MDRCDDVPIPRAFYERDAVLVARDLLGCVLIGRGASGWIVETEAYHEREAACHAWRGHTPRTAPMFGPAGTMYVYMTYGMHWCCNVVTGRRGEGAAVLIRALAPRSGIGCMRDRRTVARPESARPVTDVDLCNGPAKLVQSLAISSTDNAHDLTNGSVPGIVLGSIGAAAQPPLDVEAVRVGTRIGISVAQELPWRLGIAGPWLSRPFPDVSAS